jgi:glutamine amidotransferase
MFHHSAPHNPHFTASPAPPDAKPPSENGDDPLEAKQESPLDLLEPTVALNGERGSDNDKAQRDLLEKRKKEKAVEDERPCLFKSLSPVSCSDSDLLNSY